ncbi:hypothetical protein F5Y15DRAFT_182351 [Xylariaceae sp. FL0016]|nr:hypothetical protein F5Y15DRAFT_182351 [Xylariaceae sp. FL0016]
MVQSWLLRFSLLIALATREVRANLSNDERLNTIERSVEDLAGRAEAGDYPLCKRIEYIVVERRETEDGGISYERVPDLTKSLKARAAPAPNIPEPTAKPQKRQDDGQIQALSSQLQSLSESATQAISSVSSSASSIISLTSQSAQSVRQSADQAVQSANQAADDANRQLSQTQSSASSAVSQAQSQASDQISRSLSSMSSRIASAASSATSAISAAQAAASKVAASQVQAAQADASGVRGDANSLVEQVRSNSISGSNVAIIVAAAVVATAFVCTIVSCLVVRYRRKKRQAREEEAAAVVSELTSETNEKPEIKRKPVAVRETMDSPRFTPFKGGTYPMDKLKLPDWSPLIKSSKKTSVDSPSKIGLAKSDFTDQASGANGVGAGRGEMSGDVYGVSPNGFRLQKPINIESATTVKLIRVGSDKSKGKEKEKEKPQIQPEAPIPSPSLWVSTPLSPPPTQPLPPPPPEIAQPARVQSPPERQRSRANTIRSSTRDSEADVPGWRPPVRTTMTSQSRLRFRDSSDVESAEPTPTQTVATVTSLRNTNTASLRASPQSGSGSDSERSSPPNAGGTAAPRGPKNAGASFATFPRVRNGPPSIIDRGRPSTGVGLAARLKAEAERRKRELVEVGSGGPYARDRDSVRTSQEMFRQSRPNWPFEGGY